MNSRNIEETEEQERKETIIAKVSDQGEVKHAASSDRGRKNSRDGAAELQKGTQVISSPTELAPTQKTTPRTACVSRAEENAVATEEVKKMQTKLTRQKLPSIFDRLRPNDPEKVSHRAQFVSNLNASVTEKSRGGKSIQCK